MAQTTTTPHPRLATLARLSFRATALAAIISALLLLVQVDIYLLHHPPLPLDRVITALLRGAGTLGTGAGVFAALVGFILRRIDQRLGQTKPRGAKAVGVTSTIAGKLRPVPEQVYRLSTGQGCAYPITLSVLGFSLVVATITYVPAQQLALALHNPFPFATGTIATFSLAVGAAGPITTGPDGNLWFPESGNDTIGRISPSGTLTRFRVPTANALPFAITTGPDGALYFTEVNANAIGRISPSGAIKEFPLGAPLGFPPGAAIDTSGFPEITVGPDGNLWFGRNPGSAIPTPPWKIDQLAVAGALTEFALPAGHSAIALTAGPDGAVWFTDMDALGRITPAGVISEFPLPTAATPLRITRGPDGNLWFTAVDDATATHELVGRSTPAGAVTLFSLGTTGGLNPELHIASGPDGNLWVAREHAIARVTPSGVITQFPLPASLTDPQGITAGPDGKLYFTALTADRRAVRIGTLTP